MELMDGTQDKELYHTLFSAIKSVPGVTNPHRVRIRKIASKLDIDLDIEVDASMTVHEAHIIAEEVEKKLLKFVPAEFKKDSHHWLLLHGRYCCKAAKPDCADCPILDLCEFKKKNLPK